ncbi:interleukin-18 receptor 1-like [Periophthalmus magnuspinnatus]|uniref:interleukin-18 receptor 1-like n=1 Tax=Periophthalmus magnuspinnatus TaxID=409849 RepID=UPI002436EC77|nr:interleukin-18 receptor 1-like [Periophthalmus magnuspinnatus]
MSIANQWKQAKSNIMVKALLLLLLLFLKAVTGCTAEKICIKSGDTVALQCPGKRSNVTWSHPHNGNNHVDLLNIEGMLVLLRASEDQQGNYSCSHSVYNKTFDLRVFTTLIGDCENVTQHRKACYNGLACTLNCPTINTPPNTSVTWQQNNRTLSNNEKYYFQSVKETDQGVYICVRSFPFRGRLYNTTFTMTLGLKHTETNKNEGIISPDPDEVFFVDLGSPLVINCTALIFLDFTEIYWKISDLSINTSDSLRVKTSFSKENMDEGQKMTASLIFKEVYEEDVSAVFTCILESVSQEPISVNITLAQKEPRSYVAVAVTAVVIPVVMAIFVLIYIKYRIHITLFLRDTLMCNIRASDEKSFDAFIMYYMSEQGSGFSGDDMRTLQSVLVDQFGYSLCLFDRDVVPGKAVADAVLECVDQSRAVVLVPGSPDLSYESALLSAIHEALVERQTHLVFIKNKHTKKTDTGLQSDTLQLLTDMGHCIIWESSLAPSSFFWKQLRYYLPPVQESHRISLLP